MVLWRVHGTAQDRVHPADLVHGETDQRPSLVVVGWSWLPRAGPDGCPQAGCCPISRGVAVTGPAVAGHAVRRAAGGGDREPGMGAHGQGDVPVPGSVLSDLVVV